MRIAHTVEFYWPRIGGAERVVQRLSEHLADRGHDVTVMTSRFPGAPDEQHLQGVHVRRFDIRGNAVKGIRGEVSSFLDALRNGNYDVVMNYACQSWPTDLIVTHLDSIPGAKVLAPCGYSGLQGSRAKRRLYASYFRKLQTQLPRYDAVVYHSPSYLDFALGREWGLENGYIIPNGADLSEFSSRDIARSPLIISIANHYRAKGHQDFMSLARKLRDDGTNFALVADPKVGNLGCRRRCNRLATRSGVHRLDGSCRATVRKALLGARLVLITSRLECSPLVAIEAMAAGTPFIAYDVGSLRDFPGGLIVKDRMAMAAAIRRVMRDEVLWHRLSSAGRDYVRTLDWSSISTRYELLYRDLLSHNRLSLEVPAT